MDTVINHKHPGYSSVENSIENIHNSNLGKVSNKWSSYLHYYDKILNPLKYESIKLLEIGIQNGGSLETWCKYFENAEKIIGCDINEKCKALIYSDPRVEVIVGNANSHNVYEKIIAQGPYNIIIDDGSHLSEDILISFLNYFPALKPGGIYIIEDTHAIYWRKETNIFNKTSAFEFFKDITDIINYEFWHRDENIDHLLSKYLSISVPTFLKEGWIESVEFRNSIITVHKSDTPSHNKLGYMNVSGNKADVDAEPLRVKKMLANQVL